jgi:hypothetical protein
MHNSIDLVEAKAGFQSMAAPPQGAADCLTDPENSIPPEPKNQPPLSTASTALTNFLLQGFVLMQLGCQVALLFESLGAMRVVIRAAAFGSSILMLVIATSRGPAHPARTWAIFAIATVAVGLVHPNSNTVLASIAQVMLYVAVFAPLWWAARPDVTPALFRRLLLTFWLYHSLSATFGVLQVYYPGSYQPSVSKVIQSEILDSLKIKLANGEYVYRPMGLTDIPGGAATAGMYAFLFGLAFLSSRRAWWLSLMGIASMGQGLFCIYLCQVRSLLITTAICAAVFLGILLWRSELGRLVWLLTIVVAVVLGSFFWAVSVGSDAVTSRLSTLTEDPAFDVYYRNRGHFLDETINQQLPNYPFGAGLGRWGMTNVYFGDNSNPFTANIWVEIQWSGWLLDGGLPLIFLYAGSVLIACGTAWKVAMSHLPAELPTVGALVVAYNVGALAVTFNYPLFIGQGGLEFWLINTLLYTTACFEARRVQAAETPA